MQLHKNLLFLPFLIGSTTLAQQKPKLDEPEPKRKKCNFMAWNY